MARDLLDKIKKWVLLQKQCAKKLRHLAHEMEETMKRAIVPKVAAGGIMSMSATAMISGGVLTAVTGGAALLAAAAAAAAAGAAAPVLVSGIILLLSSIDSKSTVTSKSKKTKQIVEELQELEKEIQDLMEVLKSGAEEGQPSGSCDDDDDDANIMEQLLRSEAKQQGLILSRSVNLRRMCGLPKADISRKMVVNKALLAEMKKLLQQILLLMGKNEGKKVGESVGKKEASKTLRENAKDLWSRAEEMEEVLQKIRETVNQLVQIHVTIKNKNLSRDEKEEVIQFVIEKTQDEVVQQWLKENQASEVFFKLIELCNFIQDKLDEEEEKKKKEEEEEEKEKIDLIFVAHGKITDKMVPARCLLPLWSITDVLLYSPWNCLLRVQAGYAITTGRIRPGHRIFKCAHKIKSCVDSHHQPSPQRDNWNYMRGSENENVPEILVSPFRQPKDKAFPVFLSLKKTFGEPGAGRYVIPYLATDIGTIPFYVVTLALSWALLRSQYEATVHLAACLGKASAETRLDETYLMQQYCYTEDRTTMSVTADAIYERNDELFSVLKAVLG